VNPIPSFPLIPHPLVPTIPVGVAGDRRGTRYPIDPDPNADPGDSDKGEENIDLLNGDGVGVGVLGAGILALVLGCGDSRAFFTSVPTLAPFFDGPGPKPNSSVNVGSCNVAHTTGFIDQRDLDLRDRGAIVTSHGAAQRPGSDLCRDERG